MKTYTITFRSKRTGKPVTIKVTANNVAKVIKDN